jgi:hypothetical protein
MRQSAVSASIREDIGGRHHPTGRLPLEAVLLHLIVECGVNPLAADWRKILTDSIDGFEKRRTAY